MRRRLKVDQEFGERPRFGFPSNDWIYQTRVGVSEYQDAREFPTLDPGRHSEGGLTGSLGASSMRQSPPGRRGSMRQLLGPDHLAVVIVGSLRPPTLAATLPTRHAGHGRPLAFSIASRMVTRSAIDPQIARWISASAKQAASARSLGESVDCSPGKAADDRAQIVTRTRAPPFSFDEPIARIVHAMTS